ncbi:Gfo/Idh/MocA family protein [Salipaludibacillus daqingensis]|uniref:Gfo/Idh/MocA family protein n=1 Tax=Salipaludibacillus daqingensis TaxID=3041001 RepID=UPI0024754BA1|nr:Gfo/Idh/MocA family oxidoreductase [Salipaludibacillus daqingensis]
MSIKIGLIGTGSFSKMHADILGNMKDVTIRGICGTTKEKAIELAKGFKEANGYADFNKMLDFENLDAVYICVPPMSHGDIEKELIHRQIPFFVEKPLGADPTIVDSILADLKETSLITSVGYHFRYKQSVKNLIEFVENTQIGLVTGHWMGDMPEVAWWRKQEGSGGQFIEQTTHIVDLLRFVAGEVEDVYASYGNRLTDNKFDRVTVADVGSVTLTLKSGIVVSLSNTCILPKGISKVGMSIYTDQGMVDWEPDHLSISDAQGKTNETLNSDNPYVKESEAFIKAVRTGDTSDILSDYFDAYETHKVTFAALESSRTGLPVKI